MIFRIIFFPTRSDKMRMSTNFFKFLKIIRNDPKTYLGEVSLFALDHFWTGYIIKEHEMNENVIGAVDLHKFQRYIECLYNLGTSTRGCSHIVRDLSKNEEEAFHLFFKLLDEYMECESQLISVDCLNFLETVRKRPNLYLGIASFSALQHLINGYSARESEEPSLRITIGANLYKFQQYVGDLYNFDEPSKNWFTPIEKIAKCDTEAFHLFFKLLDDFLTKNAEGATPSL